MRHVRLTTLDGRELVGQLPSDAHPETVLVEGVDPRDQATTGKARPVFFVRAGPGRFLEEPVCRLARVEVAQ